MLFEYDAENGERIRKTSIVINPHDVTEIKSAILSIDLTQMHPMLRQFWCISLVDIFNFKEMLPTIHRFSMQEIFFPWYNRSSSIPDFIQQIIGEYHGPQNRVHIIDHIR